VPSVNLSAGLIAMGEYQEALTLTINAIDVQQRGGKFLYMPALFRMKGLIFASRSAEDYFEAKGSLMSAIDWAKRQSPTLFELKAATDLAELLLKQGRVPEAYKHLSAAVDRTQPVLYPPLTSAPCKSSTSSNPASGPSVNKRPRVTPPPLGRSIA
jgi:tetratricopeptide (TPR) repeat protein